MTQVAEIHEALLLHDGLRFTLISAYLRSSSYVESSQIDSRVVFLGI